MSNVGLEIPAIQQPAGIRCSDTKFVFMTDTCTIIYISLFIIFPPYIQRTRDSWPCMTVCVRKIFWFSLNYNASNTFDINVKCLP